MSLVHLIVGAVCIYLAGMHGEDYNNTKSKKSLYWTGFLLVAGLVNIVAMLGAALA
jgi:hypothetical protein